METTRQASPSDADRWLEFVDPKRLHSHYFRGDEWKWNGERWENLTAKRAAERLRMPSGTLLEDGARERAIYDATPSWSDLKREIPGLDVIEHPDGTKTADFRDKTLDLRQKKRLGEMLGDRRELEIEKSEVLSARVETATVGKGSRKRVVPIAKAEKVDRALHEAG